MTWGAIAGATIATVGGAVLNKNSGSSKSTTQTQIDPRMQNVLYGSGQTNLRQGVNEQWGTGSRDDYKRIINNQHLQNYGIDIPTDEASQNWLNTAIDKAIADKVPVQINPASDYAKDDGFLGRVTGQLDKPQASGLVDFGNGMNNWLGTAGVNTLGGATNAANKLMTSNIDAPTMNAASVANVPGMKAAQVNAPGQNNLNLQPAYQDMIYGEAGANPYLAGGINKAINASNNAFSNYLTDASKSTQDLLGNIRGGAIVNGAMGSSRQGIAEGKAIGDFTQNIGRAMTQFGQNNTDSALATQASAYDADRNRALSAMSGLSGNQYGVASQNASMQQQANQTNYQGGLQAALANAGFQQQANANNQGSLLTTNQLNSANQQAGINSNRALLNDAYSYGTNQDSYDLNKVAKVGGVLSNFTGLGSSQTTSQPLYQNTAANIAGGAVIGSQLSKNAGNWWNSSNPYANPNADSFNFFSNNYNSSNYG
jgi:hypothetical protein